MLLTKHNGWLLGPIATVLGLLMNAIYVVGVHNIGLNIIIFSVVVYLLMTPLTVKQQKFSKFSAKMNPELQAIQKKYKGKNNDQAAMMKMNEETKALYAKYGVSPMGTCLPLLIQMPILFALYRVIWNIPAYVGGVKDAFMPLVDKLLELKGAEAFITEVASKNAINMEKLGYSANTVVDTLNKFSPVNWADLADKFPQISDLVLETQSTVDGMNNFLGLNIGVTPWHMVTTGWNEKQLMACVVALIIPVLAGLTQWFNTKLMPQPESNNNNGNDTMSSTLKTMNTVMPLMSVFFTLTMPAGMGLYWVASAVIRSIQQIAINKYLDKVDVDEIVKKNIEKENKKREKMGLPPQKVSNVAKTNVRNIEAPKKKEISAEEKAKQISSSTEYYKNRSAKPGSLASKARMVEQYNEKSKK